MNRQFFIPAILLLSLLISGCTYYENDAGYNFHDENNRVSDFSEIGGGGFQRVQYRSPITTGNDIHANDSVFLVDDETADQIDELDEIRRATVIVSNRNAYISIVFNGKKREDEDQTRNKINHIVRNMNPEIRKVYISANPGFVRELNIYANRINERDTTGGFQEDFSQTIQKYFPASSP